VGDMLDLAIKVSKNYFRGKYSLSIQVEDIRLNGIDDDKYLLEKCNYELFKIGNNGDASLYPDRDVLAYVYRFIKKNNGWCYKFDDLYFAMKQSVTYGQLSFAIDTFCEAGLMSKNGEKIIMNKIEGKADLNNTQVIKTLKGRLKIE
jgi:ssDNA-specific exonuclease RecJ